MDTGIVEALGESLRIYVNLAIYNKDNQRRVLRASIDTGFTEFMTLSGRAIEGLGLRESGGSRMELGDGSVVYFESYSATVDWFGELRHITVHRSESAPTIGMKLIADSDVRFQAVPGGKVSLERIIDKV